MVKFYLFSQQNLFTFYVHFIGSYFFSSIACSWEVTLIFPAFFLATMQTILLIIKTMMTARTVIGVAMNTGKWKQGDVIYYNSFQFLQLVLCSILSHSWFAAKVLNIVHKWQLYCRQYESSKLEIVVVTNGHLIMLQTK